eukprot:178745-Rhodomonas_salina.4
MASAGAAFGAARAPARPKTLARPSAFREGFSVLTSILMLPPGEKSGARVWPSLQLHQVCGGIKSKQPQPPTT